MSPEAKLLLALGLVILAGALVTLACVQRLVDTYSGCVPI